MANKKSFVNAITRIPPIMWRIEDIEDAIADPGTRVEIVSIDFNEPWLSKIFMIRELNYA